MSALQIAVKRFRDVLDDLTPAHLRFIGASGELVTFYGRFNDAIAKLAADLAPAQEIPEQGRIAPEVFLRAQQSLGEFLLLLEDSTLHTTVSGSTMLSHMMATDI